MAQTTINQRLKILIEELGISVRSFSAALDVPDTNTRNYLEKGTKPSAEYLEKVARYFKSVNPHWLLTGEGPTFLEGAEAGQAGEPAPDYRKQPAAAAPGLAECEKARDAYKAERDLALKEVVLLRDQLKMKDALIEAKDETITLLRGGYSRPH